MPKPCLHPSMQPAAIHRHQPAAQRPATERRFGRWAIPGRQILSPGGLKAMSYTTPNYSWTLAPGAPSETCPSGYSMASTGKASPSQGDDSSNWQRGCANGEGPGEKAACLEYYKYSEQIGAALCKTGWSPDLQTCPGSGGVFAYTQFLCYQSRST